jgi:hypothetical protein
MKPLPVLSSLLAKGTDLQQQQIVFGSSLSFQFPQGILPETDYMEVKDGESDSVPVYKGRTFPLQLITSGSNARLTLQMCNISLYRNFRISYQQVLRQKVQVELPTMHHQATLTPTPIVTAVETVKPTTSESSTTSVLLTASLRAVTCSHEQIPKHSHWSPRTAVYLVGSD